MLYVSTRAHVDSYTAYRALHEDRTPDGGFFIPHRVPVFSAAEITEMTKKTFSERIAQILNVFFPVAFTGWDVDFAIGRHPYVLTAMSHKVYVAELWHNLQTSFQYLEKSLYVKLCDQRNQIEQPTTWARIAIRIAVLFSLCCELRSTGIRIVDIAGTTGDYSFLIAMWYVAKMGMPMGKFICTSDENSGVWEFFHNGELHPNKREETIGLSLIEILLYELFGQEKTFSYIESVEKGTSFTLNEEELLTLNNFVVSVVVSRSRCKDLINSIYRTHHYSAEPYLAMAYGGLQNYRSRSGESRTALILSEFCPQSL